MNVDKVKSLTKHLETYKNRLRSGLVPERQKGKEDSYFGYLKREIVRTEKTLESIVMSAGPKK